MCGAGGPDAREPRVQEEFAPPEFCSRVLTEDFWSRLNDQQPLLVPGVASALPARFVASELLEAFARGSGFGAVSAAKRGHQYERENFFVAYLDQGTLSLDGAERFFPVLLDLCDALAPSFDYATSQLVLDPPGCGGRPLQVNSDMLLVQLWGEQRLTVFKPFEGPGAPVLRPESLLEPHLKPGDVLCLPCGLGCRLLGSGAPLQQRGAPVPRGGGGASSSRSGAAAQGPSLYAVLKVRGEQQSFAHSLREYLNEMLLTAPFSGDADGFFRSAAMKRSLPDRYRGACGGVDQEDAPASLRKELEARLRRCAEELAPRVGAAGLTEHYAARMEKLRSAQRSQAADMAKAAAAPQERPDLVTPTALVRIARGVTCCCMAGGTVASFMRGGATLNLPIAESASFLINKLSDGSPHVVSSLPCDDPIERICVCNALVFKECLEYTEGSGTSPA